MNIHYEDCRNDYCIKASKFKRGLMVEVFRNIFNPFFDGHLVQLLLEKIVQEVLLF